MCVLWKIPAMQTTFLKGLLFCTVLFICACSKKNDEAPLINQDIAGTWQLDGRLPLMDSLWRAPVAGDTVIYTFSTKGRFTMHTPNSDNAGPYKLETAGDNTYLLTLSFPEMQVTYKVEKMASSQIRFDMWGAFCGTGYTSDRFRKTNP